MVPTQEKRKTKPTNTSQTRFASEISFSFIFLVMHLKLIEKGCHHLSGVE